MTPKNSNKKEKKGWVLTPKGKLVVKLAKKEYPRIVRLVCGDGFLYSLAVASGSFEERKK